MDTFLVFDLVDANDELRDMEANYGLDATIPIVAEDGTLVSENFNKVLSGQITVFEADAILNNVVINDLYFPTGSNDDGSVSNNLTCEGWTSNGAGLFFDDVDAANYGMFPEGGGSCSDGTNLTGFQDTLLCLCW